VAFVNGENMGTSSVSKALARHKMKHAAESVNQPGGEQQGEGNEVTITKVPTGGFHTKSVHHDGTVSEADHQSIEEATQHVHSHFGHAKPLREKNPRMREKEQPPEPTESDHGQPQPSLEAMGIDSSSGE
jgi:hypothetical protein